jgi:glutaredoxin-like protein NrdH
MSENVLIYSLSTCSHCNATKRLLSECKVEYVFKDVDLLNDQDRKAVLEDIKAFNPECSFPTIVIGKTVIVGYNEKEIMAALGRGKSGKSIFDKILAFFKGS